MSLAESYSPPSRPPHSTNVFAPRSAASSTLRSTLRRANRRTERSLLVNPPSLNTGCVNRLVVIIGTVIPVSRSASCSREICLSRVPASGRKPKRSSSWNVRPHAPSSASRCTASTTSSGGRVGSPNGSIARQPTVQSPNEKWSAGVGAAAMELSRFSMEPELIGRLLRDGLLRLRRARPGLRPLQRPQQGGEGIEPGVGERAELLAGAGVGAVVLSLDDHFPPPGGEGEAREDVAQPLVGTGHGISFVGDA